MLKNMSLDGSCIVFAFPARYHRRVFFLRYREVAMTAHSAFFSSKARYLFFSFGVAVLALNWGCGGGMPSEATLDEAAQERVQAARDATEKFLAKPKQKSANPFARKTM
jgi:hypothetical protein